MYLAAFCKCTILDWIFIHKRQTSRVYLLKKSNFILTHIEYLYSVELILATSLLLMDMLKILPNGKKPPAQSKIPLFFRNDNQSM